MQTSVYLRLCCCCCSSPVATPLEGQAAPAPAEVCLGTFLAQSVASAPGPSRTWGRAGQAGARWRVMLCAGICHLLDQNCTSFAPLFLQACLFCSVTAFAVQHTFPGEVPPSASSCWGWYTVCLLPSGVTHPTGAIWDLGAGGVSCMRVPVIAACLVLQILCPAATQSCKQVCWGSHGNVFQAA